MGFPMSDEELIIEEDIESVSPQANDAKARARAKSIVSKAILSSAQPLEFREQKDRMLIGIWYAAMNTLIECMQIEDVLLVLAAKMHQITGTGDNALSPPRTISEKAMQSYIDSVVEAGMTIIECLEKAQEQLEEEELDELFPETVLDAAAVVLQKAWGPDHLRRAIQEQSALLVRGVTQPANFMEPLKYMTPATPNTAKPEPVEEAVPVQDISEAPAKPTHVIEYVDPSPIVIKRRQINERIVTAYIANDVSSKGLNGWACWVSSSGNDRMEETLHCGTVQDQSGHSGWVQALHECLSVICANTKSARGQIELYSKDFMRAIEGQPGMRMPHHEELWKEIDAAVEHNNIDFKCSAFTLTKNYAERCDMKIRILLSGE